MADARARDQAAEQAEKGGAKRRGERVDEFALDVDHDENGSHVRAFDGPGAKVSRVADPEPSVN